MNKFWFLTIIYLMAFFLSACAPGQMNFLSFGRDQGADQFVIAGKNYAAADYLTQQIDPFVDQEIDLISATPFTNMESPGLDVELGREIPRHIGERFLALGYPTEISEVADPVDTAFADDPTQYKAPDFILKGTFKPYESGIMVFARVIATDDGHVAGAFDYTLPIIGHHGPSATPEIEIELVEEPAPMIAPAAPATAPEVLAE